MNKKYRAKIALNTKTGIIKVGKIVPADYTGLDRAIKMGWVEEILVDEKSGKQYIEIPAKPAIAKPEPAKTEPEPKVEMPMETVMKPYESAEPSTTQPVSVLTDVNMETPISDLKWLTPAQIKSLDNAEIEKVADLYGYNLMELCAIKEIGKSTANKLISVHRRCSGG